jgi:thiol-disulfide isomerase/thioredoxin
MHQVMPACSAQDSIKVQVFETFDEFETEILKTSEDRVILVNFWATWCVPCIKELPYFEALGEEMSGEKLDIILVSIDYKNRLEDKVIPFLEKNNIRSKVVLLNDAKANNWIDRVDPSWSGAIPITLILKGDERYFFEREFENTEALKTIIEPILKP